MVPTKANEISIGVGTFKVISREKIPSATRQRTQELGRVLSELEDNNALTATEKELGVTIQSIKGLIKRLKNNGDLTDDYDVTTRTKNGVRSVYIVRAKKSE